MSSHREDVTTQVAVANRVLAETGLAAGVRASLGHASMRIPSEPDKFVVKGRGYRMDILSRMRPEDMVVCDLEGNLVEGPPGIIQCGEVMIHSCIYRARPDVQSIVHVHPKFTVVMSVLKATLVPMAQEGILVVRHPLPVYPHSKVVTTEAEGQEVARLLGSGRAVILFGHGAVTADASLEQSVMTMIQLEHQAEMNYHAYCAMGSDHPSIPDQLVEEIARGRSYDAPHFRAAIARAGMPKYTGIWHYYAELVSGDL